MEAHNDKVPLVLLTADRPPELRDCGANQTCDQAKLFEGYVRFQVDLPCPGQDLPRHFLASTLTQAIAMATGSPKGPVHINAMFREPLISEPGVYSSSPGRIAFAHPELYPHSACVEEWADRLAEGRSGVILAGSNTDGQEER